MLTKPYTKQYNMLQYLSLDKYTTFSELNKKTNISISALKKQVVYLRKELRDSGYAIESGRKGVKLLKGNSEYLPYDLIFFNTLEYYFAETFIEFIKSGLSHYTLFPQQFTRKYYTKRQIRYFFIKRLNINFSEFRNKSNFEYFNIFVEYCILWFSCLNIKELFGSIYKINEFNELLLSYDEHKKISAYDYILIYSVLVFDKVNSAFISAEYEYLMCYFKQNKYVEGVRYFKIISKLSQNYQINDSLIDYYCELNGISKFNVGLDYSYKNINDLAYEIAYLQSEISTKVRCLKKFNLYLIYEGHEESLSVIKGALKKNYPNVKIYCIPAWIYFYKEISIDGIIFSNTFFSLEIDVIPHRDAGGNYNFNF